MGLGFRISDLGSRVNDDTGGGRSNIAAVRKMTCHWDYYDDDAHAVISIIDQAA